MDDAFARQITAFPKYHLITEAMQRNFTARECQRGMENRAQQMNIYLMAVFYATVFLISFVGNATVVYVMVIRAKTTNVMNLLITNLAVSDFFVCITSLWLTPLYWYTGQWMWGSMMCHFFPLFQGISICNSSMTLLVIAVDRYVVVCKNQNSSYKQFNLNTRNCKFVIVVIWTIAITLVMPYALNMRTRRSAMCGHMKCTEMWSTGTVKAAYGLVVTMFQFVIPMVFIGFSYMKIFMFLQRQCQESNYRLRVVSNKKNALFRMLFVMVVAFAVCWLPVNILNVMRDIGLDHLLGRRFSVWFMRAHMLSMTGVMMNPLIYAFMNQNFRDEFCRVVPVRYVVVLPKKLWCRQGESAAANGAMRNARHGATNGLLNGSLQAKKCADAQKPRARALFSYYDEDDEDTFDWGLDNNQSTHAANSFTTCLSSRNNSVSALDLFVVPKRSRSRSIRTVDESGAHTTKCCASCSSTALCREVDEAYAPTPKADTAQVSIIKNPYAADSAAESGRGGGKVIASPTDTVCTNVPSIRRSIDHGDASTVDRFHTTVVHLERAAEEVESPPSDAAYESDVQL